MEWSKFTTIPMYLQNAMKSLAHKKGDFPEADYQASNNISMWSIYYKRTARLCN